MKGRGRGPAGGGDLYAQGFRRLGTLLHQGGCADDRGPGQFGRRVRCEACGHARSGHGFHQGVDIGGAGAGDGGGRIHQVLVRQIDHMGEGGEQGPGRGAVPRLRRPDAGRALADGHRGGGHDPRDATPAERSREGVGAHTGGDGHDQGVAGQMRCIGVRHGPPHLRLDRQDHGAGLGQDIPSGVQSRTPPDQGRHVGSRLGLDQDQVVGAKGTGVRQTRRNGRAHAAGTEEQNRGHGHGRSASALNEGTIFGED